MTKGLAIIIIILFATSCNSFKSFVVKDNLKFKRKSELQDRRKLEETETWVRNRIYYLPADLCAKTDSVRMKAIADKIFRKNHRRYLYDYLDNYKLVMTSDTTGYFAYNVKVIHGYDQMTYNKNKCTITFRHAGTGKF